MTFTFHMHMYLLYESVSSGRLDEAADKHIDGRRLADVLCQYANPNNPIACADKQTREIYV